MQMKQRLLLAFGGSVFASAGLCGAFYAWLGRRGMDAFGPLILFITAVTGALVFYFTVPRAPANDPAALRPALRCLGFGGMGIYFIVAAATTGKWGAIGLGAFCLLVAAFNLSGLIRALNDS